MKNITDETTPIMLDPKTIFEETSRKQIFNVDDNIIIVYLHAGEEDKF